MVVVGESRARVALRQLGQLLDHAHDLATAAERADGHAATDRLGQAEQVGLDAEPFSGAAVGDARRRS